ncbi:MAG: hypothetical protein AB7J28_13635 [Hyphomonadaceae bacterium]
MLRSALAAFALSAPGAAMAQPGDDPFANARAQRVAIDNYHGDVISPFLARDGRTLLYNNRPDGSASSDLLYAVRVTAHSFRFVGPVLGANSPERDATASMDRAGRFYFVSERAYERTLNTLYTAPFAGGTIGELRAVTGLETREGNRIIADAEISGDGRSIYFSDALRFGGDFVWEADLHVARRYGVGVFARDNRSRAIFARINTPDLEYAPALSVDEREIYFTRRSRMPFSAPIIMRAARGDPRIAFGAPADLRLDGWVESPSVAADGSVYFSRREDGEYRLWRLPRNPSR